MKKLFFFVLLLVFRSSLFAQTPIYEWIGEDSQSLKAAFGDPADIKSFDGIEMYIYENELGYQSFQFQDDKIIKLNTTTFWKTKSQAKSALNQVIKFYKNDGFRIVQEKSKNLTYAANEDFKATFELTYKDKWYWVSETVVPLEDSDEEKGDETDAEVTNGEKEAFTFVEVMPEYPGGSENLYEFIKKNLIYPEAAKSAQIEGKVMVGFVVEKDGRLTNFRIVAGKDESCNEEAMRLCKMMGKWNPGTQGGKPVRVSMVVPISFRL